MADRDGSVVLVGLAGGWAEATGSTRALLGGADVLVGDPDVLADVPHRWGQHREAWPDAALDGPGGGSAGPLADLLQRHAGWSVVVVGAGDPLRSARGRALVALLGTDLRAVPGVPPEVRVAAGLGWASYDVVDLAGRGLDALRRELADGRRLLVLPGDVSADAVEGLLVGAGYGGSRVVPGDGAVALELRGPLVSPWLAGLPDASYEPTGRVLPRDVRAGVLARLAPQPGQLLWDLGSGGGCVAVEWMRAHPDCTAVAVEPDEAGRAAAVANARRLGVPGLRTAADTAGLPTPHAVLVAGPACSRPVLDAAQAALAPGGRLVAVVEELAGEALLAERYAATGGELTRVAVDVARWTGSEARWAAHPPVTRWAWQRAT